MGAFLGRLLNPEVEESAGLATGDLLVTLFRKAGDAVAPLMRPLLEECVKRLSTAKTATGSQVCNNSLSYLLITDLIAYKSLIIPFAFLIHKDPTSVLDLLEGMTLENGQNGLRVLLSAWCENADTFIGGWATRMRLVYCNVLYALADSSIQPCCANPTFPYRKAKPGPNSGQR